MRQSILIFITIFFLSIPETSPEIPNGAPPGISPIAPLFFCLIYLAGSVVNNTLRSRITLTQYKKIYIYKISITKGGRKSIVVKNKLIHRSVGGLGNSLLVLLNKRSSFVFVGDPVIACDSLCNFSGRCISGGDQTAILTFTR